MLRQHQLGDRAAARRRCSRGSRCGARCASDKPGLLPEERVHPVLVAGEDHDQVVALVLHHLQQDLDRLLPVVALVLGPVEVVGLVDEQHAAHRLLQHLLGLRRGVADVLADEVVARHRRRGGPCARSRARCRISAIRSATVVLPVPGLPVKLMCSDGAPRGEPELRARAVDQQQRGDLADALLHRREADQLAVEPRRAPRCTFGARRSSASQVDGCGGGSLPQGRGAAADDRVAARVRARRAGRSAA